MKSRGLGDVYKRQPQYAGLEALYKKYAAQGLVVLGFPCNQFGKQEPGGADEIEQTCHVNYGVRVNFVVEQHEVTAEYLVVMDQRKLDAGQHSELVNQYHAVQIDNDRLGVLFKATGFWTASDASDLAAAYQLAHPVVVSINDKTKTISSLGAVAMAPLFPFYMMYGLSLIHISEPTRLHKVSRMPSSA